jgi:hypothetical protein
MKRTKLKLILPIVLSGLIFSNVSFAADLENTKMIRTCEMIAQALFKTASDNSDKNVTCVNDVKYAGANLNIAAMGIRQSNYPQAYIFIVTAEKSMKSLQGQWEKCPIFGPLVRPHIKAVMALKNELIEKIK